MERALLHARRAVGPQAPVDTWVLAIQLAGEVEGIDAALTILRRGINIIPPSGNLFVLYQLGGELLARDNQIGKAIELLREGITKIPPQFSGYRLGEQALYMAVAAKRQDWLEEFIAGKDGISLGPPERALGMVLLRQMEGIGWAQPRRLSGGAPRGGLPYHCVYRRRSPGWLQGAPMRPKRHWTGFRERWSMARASH